MASASGQKISGNDAEEIRAFRDGEMIVICYREAHVDTGAMRRKWSEDRVALLPTDLREILARFEAGKL